MVIKNIFFEGFLAVSLLINILSFISSCVTDDEFRVLYLLANTFNIILIVYLLIHGG
jgi:hypothetical protein